MKKTLLVLMALLMMLTVSVALAAGEPTVSFTAKSGNINGGFDYELGIKVNKAQSSDLTVYLVNNTTDENFTIVIPAGETTASATIPTEVVAKSSKMTFSFIKNDAYNTGSMHTLNVKSLPKVQFYSAVTHAYVGNEMSVLVLCNTPSTVVKGNAVFTLKDHRGNVLAEKEWKNPSERTSFKFTVTQEMHGRNDLTVWLGDYCVSPDDGYAVVTGPEDRAVKQMNPSLPIMSIGIDCGFEGRKVYDILEVLEKHNAKVTFFMTGYFLREFPEQCKAILAAGHEIATHSNTHKHLPQERTSTQYSQITIPIEEAEELLGVTPRLFRPPHGEYDRFTTGISVAEGMRVIMWGPTYHDSTGKYTEKQIFSCATTGNEYRPGTVVLCHANGYYQPDTLEAGLTHYESLGLHVVPISAMLYYSGDKLPAMPHNREALVYTDEYWETWIERERPDLLEMPMPEHFKDLDYSSEVTSQDE